MSLIGTLSDYWRKLQGVLFPEMEEELGPLTARHEQFILVLGLIQLELFLPSVRGGVGRPREERVFLARAFVAKMIFNLPTTEILLDWLRVDKILRRQCGWERRSAIPSSSTFSRAFAEFAESGLPCLVHEALIKASLGKQIVGHISRDSTAIEAREKPQYPAKTPPAPVPAEAKPAELPLSAAGAAPEQTEVPNAEPQAAAEPVKRKRGRPRKNAASAAADEPSAPEKRRLEQQPSMTLEEMLEQLPILCNKGAKKNAKGHTETWIGYKLHVDTADGDIPVSFILTSASLHDSQVAIPLAVMTDGRVTSLYDLMDKAYDAAPIRAQSAELGHVPIIAINPRRNKALKEELEQEEKRLELINFRMPEAIRYQQRSAAERVNSNLKDNFGGRMIRVRGHAKVLCHLAFGLVCITAIQLMRLLPE